MVHHHHLLQVHCDLYLQHLQRDHRVCDRPLHSHSEVYFVINTFYVSFGSDGKKKTNDHHNSHELLVLKQNLSFRPEKGRSSSYSLSTRGEDYAPSFMVTIPPCFLAPFRFSKTSFYFYDTIYEQPSFADHPFHHH